jgi:ABC-type branched-subunit amino acid transport system substrate-binding protein
MLGALAVTSSPTGSAATNSTGAARPASVRGVTPTAVTVGGLGSTLLFGRADVGATARFTRANAEGGVNGRTIDYVGFRDDQGVATGNEQAASGLVQQDAVFAVVPVVTPDLAAARALVAARVPYFGWALSSNFCGNRYGFGITGCQLPPGGRTTSNAWGVLVKAALGAQVAQPTAAVLGENTPSGQYLVRALSAGATSAGISVVSATSNLPVPPSRDYAAIAGAVLGANAGRPPDAVFLSGSFSNVSLVRRALRDAGFAGIVTDAIDDDPALVSEAAGTSVMLQTAAVESAPTNPAMQQLIADVNAVAPGQTIDQTVMAGYWSADLFIAALQRAGRKLTVNRFVKLANRSFTYRVTGTVGPTRFPAAHDVPTPCGSLVRSDGTAFSVQMPYTCGRVVRVRP